VLGDFSYGARPGDGLRSDCGRAVAAVREGRVAEDGSPERALGEVGVRSREPVRRTGETCLIFGRAKPSATLGGRDHPERSGRHPAWLKSSIHISASYSFKHRNRPFILDVSSVQRGLGLK